MELHDAAVTYPSAEARRRTVLVAVVNNAEDLRRAAAEGWYRIPQRKAPRRIGADYLAFYQTGAFGDVPEAHSVTYYASTQRYQLTTRRELLPAEADHPRAAEYYFRIEIGPFRRLEPVLHSARLRRITFIHTTLNRLLTAKDVRELFEPDDPFEKLWQALVQNRLRPQKNRILGDRPMDITLRARGGYLGIRCADGEAIPQSGTREAPTRATRERWETLWLPFEHIERDLDGCLRRIGAALINLGGSVLNEG